MEGTRDAVTGADGVRIGLLTAGSGPGLLLVHGGMGTVDSWQHVGRADQAAARDRGAAADIHISGFEACRFLFGLATG